MDSIDFGCFLILHFLKQNVWSHQNAGSVYTSIRCTSCLYSMCAVHLDGGLRETNKTEKGQERRGRKEDNKIIGCATVYVLIHLKAAVCQDIRWTFCGWDKHWTNGDLRADCPSWLVYRSLQICLKCGAGMKLWIMKQIHRSLENFAFICCGPGSILKESCKSF